MEQTESKSGMGNPQSHEVEVPVTPGMGAGAMAGIKTVMSSVLFLDIVAYSRKSVSQQMELKNELNLVLGAAISLIPMDERIILDTGDGAAISFLSDVEDALKVALVLRKSLQDEEGPRLINPMLVRMGINLGPVRLIKDINGQPNIVGDGINVAQRVMEFSEAGQILISRSYYDAISNLSHDYAGMLHFHGKFTDKHVREHDVYLVSSQADMALSAPDADTGEEGEGPDKGAGGYPGFIVKLSGQPAVLIGGILVGVLLLVVANLIRVESRDARPGSAAVTASSRDVTNGASDSTLPKIASIEWKKQEPPSMAPKPREQIKLKPAPRAPRVSSDGKVSPEKITASLPANPEHTKPDPVAPVEMATISIAVTPWGEVYLDGKIRGISPPLTEIKVRPGNHNIEIRNKTYPQYRQYFRVTPGEKKEIRYKFTDTSK